MGLNLPARLLFTAVRGSESAGLPPRELLTLGTALLAALSTEPDMACSPQLLATAPLLLSILANGPVLFNQPKREVQERHQKDEGPDCEVPSANISKPDCDAASAAHSADEAESSKQCGDGSSATQEASPYSSLDASLAADCYLILTAVCASPRGPEQLLNRGAVSALCQAVERNQTFSHEKGLVLLGSILSGITKGKAWRNHSSELVSLLVRLSKDFCQSSNEARLGLCTQMSQFLPQAGVATEKAELKEAVSHLWEALRPMVQAKLTPRQIGPMLVLTACLLDLYGWDLAGPPKFCCLLVNRACIEVRMGLEQLPGSDLTLELQHTLTGSVLVQNSTDFKFNSLAPKMFKCK